jgi:hypothetical protein
MGALHQQVPEKLVAGFGDVELGFKRPGFVLAGTQTKVRAYRSSPGETTGIFYGEHEGKRR